MRHVIGSTSLPDELRLNSGADPVLDPGVRIGHPQFTRWPSSLPGPSDTKGNKPLVNLDGEVLFAELAILTLLIRDGWDGRWIDNYPPPPTFRLAYWDRSLNKLPRAAADRPLPAEAREIYEAICAAAGDTKGGGAWDILAWRGDAMLFIEAKRKSSTDRLRDGQRQWFQGARRIGIPADCFVFVEWELLPAGS